MQRQHAPVFNVVIELTTRDSWLVYPNAAEAVDAILARAGSVVPLAQQKPIVAQWRRRVSSGTGLTIVAEQPQVYF